MAAGTLERPGLAIIERISADHVAFIRASRLMDGRCLVRSACSSSGALLLSGAGTPTVQIHDSRPVLQDRARYALPFVCVPLAGSRNHRAAAAKSRREGVLGEVHKREDGGRLRRRFVISLS